MRRHGRIKLSELARLAKSDGFGGRDLQHGEKVTEGGTLFAVGSDAKSGSINPLQYSRRKWQANRGEFQQFQRIARGSAAELETQLLICKKIGYLVHTDINPAMDLLTEISKMTTALLKKR